MKLSQIDSIEDKNSSKKVSSLSNDYFHRRKADECRYQSLGDFADIETEINAIDALCKDFNLDHLNLAFLNLDSE